MTIPENLNYIKSRIPANVKLIAISKTHPAETVMIAYNAGQRIFGENKVQEMLSKCEQMPKEIEWHLVGHLQTNKVKFIAPFVKLIHSVDSLKLLAVINNEAKKNNRIINCLLQVYIAKEETKFGLAQDEIESILNSQEYKRMENIQVIGLMGMASFTENTDQIRQEFKSLKIIFNNIKTQYFTDKDYFRELSMGMSSDFSIAIEEGSTMIRIGSIIFGERNYTKR